MNDPTSPRPLAQFGDAEWADVCQTVNRGLQSNLHCSIATVNPDGSPHLSPIGSVHLLESTPDGRRDGLFFEMFATTLGQNLERDPRFTLLAVDSSPDFWFQSLEQGQFEQKPGVRLKGTAGSRRLAQQEEIDHFLRFTKPLSHLKGHDMLWGNPKWVRDLHFQEAQPIRLGPMTSGVA